MITPFVRHMQHLFNGSLSGKPVVVATPLGKKYKETAWILREFEAEVALVLGVRVISGSSRLAERELNALADLHVLGHSKAFLGWSVERLNLLEIRYGNAPGRHPGCDLCPPLRRLRSSCAAELRG